MIWNHYIGAAAAATRYHTGMLASNEFQFPFEMFASQPAVERAAVCVFAAHFHLNASYSFFIHVTRTCSLLKWIINRRCVNLARRKVIMKFSLTSWKSCLTSKTSYAHSTDHPPASHTHTLPHAQLHPGAQTQLVDIQCDIRCGIKWINAQGFRANILLSVETGFSLSLSHR